MGVLKNVLYLSACGLGSLMRREYFKGIMLTAGLWLSLGCIVLGIYSEDIYPFILLPLGLFSFFFVWIYNALETFDNQGLRRKKVEIRDNTTEAYYQGMSAYLKKDYELAIEHFNTVLKQNKNDADVYFQLGKVYFKSDNKKCAKKMLNKYLLFDTKGKWEVEAKEYLYALQKK